SSVRGDVDALAGAIRCIDAGPTTLGSFHGQRDCAVAYARCRAKPGECRRTVSALEARARAMRSPHVHVRTFLPASILREVLCGAGDARSCDRARAFREAR